MPELSEDAITRFFHDEAGRMTGNIFLDVQCRSDKVEIS